MGRDPEPYGGTGGASGGQAGTQDLGRVWAMLIEDLPPNQRAWLAASRPVTVHENTAIIAVADEFTRNQLEGRLRTRLEDSLTESLGQHVRIAVTVDPELDPTPDARYNREDSGTPDHRPQPGYRQGYETQGFEGQGFVCRAGFDQQLQILP